MSDLTEFYEDLKEESRERRADNRRAGAALLKEHCVPFLTKNQGCHLIVDGGHLGTVDYWPGTGRWIARTGKKSGRGIHNLLRFLQIPKGVNNAL